MIDSSRVRGIGVTAQMHSLVALDEKLQVIRPMISCVDTRNDAQIREGYEKTGGEAGFLALTDNRMVASCTGGKILWMREEESELFRRIACVITPKDYFRLILTGLTGTDESDASGYGLYDVEKRCWSRELLERIGIPEKILPEVKASNAPAGRILPEIADELGIPRETAVVMGGGDAIVQPIGAGAAESGVYSVILGSGGNASASASSFYRNEEGKVQFYASSLPGRWTAYAGIMSIGNTTNWFKNVFVPGHKDPFRILEKEAREASPGSRGLLFYPSMLGQRNPIEDTRARGMFLGLDIEHSRGHMFRAILEGIAMGMREVSDELIPACGKRKSLVLSGGGAENDLWCQIFADVFRIPAKRADHAAYCGAKGAAILAAGCGESAEELEKRCKMARIDRSFEPSDRSADLYAELFEIYKTMYGANRDIFHRLEQLRSRWTEIS